MGKCESRGITVRATLDANEENGVAFEMLENGQVICDGRIVSEKTGGMSKDDYHEVIFTLDDQTNRNLLFAAQPGTAMWVKKKKWYQFSPSCPRSPSDHRHIPAVSVTGDRLRLEVRNHNPRKKRYGFTLNFQFGGVGELVPYDPIWDNRNGGAH